MHAFCFVRALACVASVAKTAAIYTDHASTLAQPLPTGLLAHGFPSGKWPSYSKNDSNYYSLIAYYSLHGAHAALVPNFSDSLPRSNSIEENALHTPLSPLEEYQEKSVSTGSGAVFHHVIVANTRSSLSSHNPRVGEANINEHMQSKQNQSGQYTSYYSLRRELEYYYCFSSRSCLERDSRRRRRAEYLQHRRRTRAVARSKRHRAARVALYKSVFNRDVATPDGTRYKSFQYARAKAVANHLQYYACDFAKNLSAHWRMRISARGGRKELEPSPLSDLLGTVAMFTFMYLMLLMCLGISLVIIRLFPLLVLLATTSWLIAHALIYSVHTLYFIFVCTLHLAVLPLLCFVNGLPRMVTDIVFSPISGTGYLLTRMLSTCLLLSSYMLRCTLSFLRDLSLLSTLHLGIYLPRLNLCYQRLAYPTIWVLARFTRLTDASLDAILGACGYFFRYYQVYCSTEYRLRYCSSLSTVTGQIRFHSLLLLWLALSHAPACADSDGSSAASRPPVFDGTRQNFLPWVMAFSGWVAYRLTDSSDMLEGLDPRPTDPEPDPVAEPVDHKVWEERREKWARGNKKLYGAILSALPDWLRTSIYLSFKGDGLAAMEYLRDSFDAIDANDHAAQIARLGAHYIDPKNDLSEGDLRLQYDSMMTAATGILRTGNHPPAESAMIAMFDNSLPIAYGNIRQLVRRSKHTTLLAHYNDYMGQVRAELAARAPRANAFFTGGGSGGGGGGGGGGSGGGGGGGGGGAPPSNPCLRCGKTGHRRPKCSKTKTKCRHCGADHMSSLCPKGPGSKWRDALSEAARNILQADVERAAGDGTTNGGATNAQAFPAPNATPSTSANQAASAPVVPPPPPPGTVPAVTPGGATNSATSADAAAHAFAASAAAAHTDPALSGQAYVAALRTLGFGMCATPAAMPAAHVANIHPPIGTKLVNALVDTMATMWVVNDASLLHKVTDPSPGMSLNTAKGQAKVDAIGTAQILLLTYEGTWRSYQIPDVLFMSECPENLYSTRVMNTLFGLKHDTDGGRIHLPRTQTHGSSHVNITDDGASYIIPVAFVPRGRATDVKPMVSRSHALTAGMPGTPQAILYHRLGFPHEHQWRHVTSSVNGHGLPPNTVVSTTIPVREAVVRGRARTPRFIADSNKTHPAPGSVIYSDFAGPLLASYPHRFTVYICYVDAGSGYGRLFPAHSMSAQIATATLEVFIADLAAKMGLTSGFKPTVVRSDQGSAYISHHFREFLSQRQIQQQLACTYTPQQNSHAERFWGSCFGLARVLLAAANLPPTFHPFALQTAAWIQNRLPRESKGNLSPFSLLTRTLADISMLFAFGCLCAFTLPSAWREGDKHFADRGEHAIYLGPSELSPGHVVYLLSFRRIETRAKIRVWEDQFPGIKGDRYTWFADETSPDLSESHMPAQEGQQLLSPGGATTAPVAMPENTEGATNGGSSTPTPAQPSPAPPSSVVSSVPPLSTPRSSVSEPPHRSTAQVAPMPSLEEHSTTHPQAGNPRSRHYERHHPQRERKTVPRLIVHHGPGQYGTKAMFSLIAVRPSAPSLLARLAVFMTALPSSLPIHVDSGCFAFSSHTFSIDGAFGKPLDDGDEDSILNSVTIAAAFSAVTITADLGNIPIPKGYRQATSCEHAAYWIDAINKELGGLLSRGTWTYVRLANLPRGANVMRCHYVFTVKRKSDGSIEKFKARLVADGNTQKYGVDFNRIFSTVVKASTLRLLLVIAAAHDFDLHQIDITQAYLQANVTEDLYMTVPPGMHAFDKENMPICCKLRRTLYGLRQSGREWGELLASFLIAFGFVRSSIDTCLFTFGSTASLLWVAIYVDDILLLSNDKTLRLRFMAAITKRFPTEDKGELQWLLGLSVTRDRANRTLSLSQELFVSDITQRFASHIAAGHSRRYDTPMQEGLLLDGTDSPTEGSPEYDALAPQRTVYPSIIGAILWLANMTRPDIAFAASQLARFLSNPGMAHYHAALRVLIYLDNTRDRSLVFKPNTNHPLSAYVDSNWATKFSCTGGIFFFFGSPIFWFAKLQRSVSLSSAEAEFFGASLAAKELIFLRELIIDLAKFGLFDIKSPSVLYCDSKSAIDISVDPVAFKKTKHILRAAEFLRDLVLRCICVLEHLPGDRMPADMLTKPLSRAKFILALKLLDTLCG